MKLPFKLFDMSGRRPARLMRRETSHLRALPDHIRRDIGLPECGSVGREMSRNRASLIGL